MATEMKKAEYKLYRGRRKQIENVSRQNENPFSFLGQASNTPIFMPKRKKR